MTVQELAEAVHVLIDGMGSKFDFTKFKKVFRAEMERKAGTASAQEAVVSGFHFGVSEIAASTPRICTARDIPKLGPRASSAAREFGGAARLAAAEVDAQLAMLSSRPAAEAACSPSSKTLGALLTLLQAAQREEQRVLAGEPHTPSWSHWRRRCADVGKAFRQCGACVGG